MSELSLVSNRRPTPIAALGLTALMACGHASPAGQRLPPRDPVIVPPPVAVTRVEPVGLTHLLRGLWYLKAGRAAASVPHLRMAQMYDARSAFVVERLSEAWAASGQLSRAEQVLADGLRQHPDALGLNRVAGLWALRQRRYAGAADHLSRAVEAAERQGSFGEVGPFLAGALVDALLWTGALDGARRWASRMGEQHAGRPDWALAVGAAFEDHGWVDEAVALYREVARRRPTERRPALALARASTLVGRYEEAARAIIALCELHGDDVGLLAHVARLLWSVAPAEAAAYRTEALRRAEGDPARLATVGASDLRAGRLDAGVALLGEAAHLAAEGTELRLAIAQMLAEHGQAQDCLRILREQHALSPRATLLRVDCERRARLTSRSGGAESSAELAHAVRASAEPGGTVRQAVGLICRDGDRASVLARVDRLLTRLDGSLSPSEVALARVDAADCVGATQTALELLAEAVRGQSPAADLQLYLADLQARSGRLEDAVVALERLLEQQPEDPVRLNALGFVLTEANTRLQEAAVWLRRAHRLAPDEAFILDSLGWLHFRQGQLEDAERLLRRASAVAPQDAEILGHLGEVLLARGERQRARRALEQALAQHPAPVLRTVLQRRLNGLAR